MKSSILWVRANTIAGRWSTVHKLIWKSISREIASGSLPLCIMHLELLRSNARKKVYYMVLIDKPSKILLRSQLIEEERSSEKCCPIFPFYPKLIPIKKNNSVTSWKKNPIKLETMSWKRVKKVTSSIWLSKEIWLQRKNKQKFLNLTKESISEKLL